MVMNDFLWEHNYIFLFLFFFTLVKIIVHLDLYNREYDISMKIYD